VGAGGARPLGGGRREDPGDSHAPRGAGRWLRPPLVIRLTEGRKNAYVRHHATEALNFQITFMIAWFAGFAVWVGVLWSSDPAGGNAPPAWVLIVFVTMMGVMLANFALSILGCVRANQSRWWRYPINIRFVRGARPKGHDQRV
jgi:uncharacterized Tic20 family protein